MAERKSVCDDCGKATRNPVPLHDVPNLHERIDAGQEVPSGACRRCGALTYLAARANAAIGILRNAMRWRSA